MKFLKTGLLFLSALSFFMIFTSCGGDGGGNADAITYSVVFEENEADILLTDLTGIEEGDTVPQPDAIDKSGNLFDGWFSSAAFEEESRWTFGDTGTPVTGNITLYAKWIPFFEFADYGAEVMITGLTDVGKTVEDLVCPLIHNGKPVTYIGGDAIRYNSTIKSITIGRTITEIAEPPFLECNNLENIVVVDENEYFRAVDGVLYDKEITKLICYPPAKTAASYTTPDTVETLGPFALFNAVNLETIIIGDNVTLIEDYAFRKCGNLTSITLPAGLTQLSQGLFTQCVNLSSVTIPSSVTNLPSYLFDGCTILSTVAIPGLVTTISSYCFVNSGLTSIHIPESVTTIESGAFENAVGLATVVMEGDLPPLLTDTSIFSNTDSNLKFYVPTGYVDDYKGTASWITYVDQIFDVAIMP